MSKICKKCNKEFKAKLVLEGKVYNLKSRKYCLDCSPFKQHNTRVLEDKERKKKYCSTCDKEIIRKNEKGTSCWTCVTRSSRDAKIAKMKSLVGDSCLHCGYNKCWQALDFHHVDKKNKKFNLTRRELQYSWQKIESELRKCVLLCCRCHRELHAGLIPNEIIERKWRELWSLSEPNDDKVV